MDFVDVGRTYRIDGVLRLARLLRRERADVLHTHTLAAANALARIAGRLARVPVVSHLHIANHFRPATRALLANLDNATARLAAALVAVSEDTRRAYEDQGYPRRIRVVYNGVTATTADANGLREELSIPADAPLVAEVGRLCDVKGQRELIDAIALAARRARRPRGRRPRAGRCVRASSSGSRRPARRPRPRRVRRLPRRRRACRCRCGRPCAAIVDGGPAARRARGDGARTARSSRRRSAARPRSSPTERRGCSCRRATSRALTAALKRVLDDEELRRRLGEAGRRRVEERFSSEAMTRDILAVYDEVTR